MSFDSDSPVSIAFDSPDEKAELVNKFAEDGKQAVLTPSHTDDDGLQWYSLTTEPSAVTEKEN